MHVRKTRGVAIRSQRLHTSNTSAFEWSRPEKGPDEVSQLMKSSSGTSKMCSKIVAQVSSASLCAIMGVHRNRRARNETRPRYPEISASGAESDLHIRRLCISIETTRLDLQAVQFMLEVVSQPKDLITSPSQHTTPHSKALPSPFHSPRPTTLHRDSTPHTRPPPPASHSSANSQTRSHSAHERS